ncbi:MAG: DNA-directed RNA polymerase subunit K [Candidatus Pacearchaeota archaeon]|nr:DNA-directed RNA polymerase subunit K [Candidatus Pacearchaeota archaeon]
MAEEIEFTRYEIARILGARALQISMDAPLLLEISDEELESIRYDALKIADKEFYSGVLPISVKRPMPKMNVEKLRAPREDKVDDKKIIEKEKEEEKEIAESAEEMGFENPDAEELADEDEESNE